jgi:hypothetical protein
MNEVSNEHFKALCEAQGGLCALSRLKLSFVEGDAFCATLDRVEASDLCPGGRSQVVCRWVKNAKAGLSNVEFKRVLLALKCDGVSDSFMSSEWVGEASGPTLAFLCSVYDAVLEGCWGISSLMVEGTDKGISFGIANHLLLRLHDYGEGVMMDCELSGNVRGECVDLGWPDSNVYVPVDVADPGTPGRIVKLLLDGFMVYCGYFEGRVGEILGLIPPGKH